MIGSIPRAASAATADSPMAPAPTTTGTSSGCHVGRADVELADRKRVGQRHGVTGDVAVDGFGDRLGDHQQLGETALRLGMLADDAGTVGAAVHQPDGHGRHPGTDRELVGASGAVPDHLADELVTEHDVAVRVVQRPAGGVVDAELRVVHEVDIGGADRGGQRLQQEFTLPGYRVRGVSDLESSVLQNHRPHDTARVNLDYSRRLLELLISP